MRTFGMYSFGNFQIYNSVLLAVVTVLHNTSLGFLYLIKVCTCTCFSCPLAHQHPLFLKVSDQMCPLITYIKWQSPVPIFHLLPCSFSLAITTYHQMTKCFHPLELSSGASLSSTLLCLRHPRQGLAPSRHTVYTCIKPAFYLDHRILLS